MSEVLNDLSAYISGKLGDQVARADIAYGELTLRGEAIDIIPVLTFLRDDPSCQFVSIIDICGADYPSRAKRFDVVYHLLSPRKNVRVRVKVQTDEETPVPSVTGVYPGADWFEREAWDMFGIVFRGHPNLVRILMEDDWEGHPLRKDYPIGGEPVRFSGEE